jgi:hypothetical protein
VTVMSHVLRVLHSWNFQTEFFISVYLRYKYVIFLIFCGCLLTLVRFLKICNIIHYI